MAWSQNVLNRWQIANQFVLVFPLRATYTIATAAAAPDVPKATITVSNKMRMTLNVAARGLTMFRMEMGKDNSRYPPTMALAITKYMKADRLLNLASNWKNWVKNGRVSSVVPMAIAAEIAAAMASNLRTKSKISTPLILHPTGGGSGSFMYVFSDTDFILKLYEMKLEINFPNLVARPRWQITIQVN